MDPGPGFVQVSELTPKTGAFVHISLNLLTLASLSANVNTGLPFTATASS